jgi:hypothetical protein
VAGREGGRKEKTGKAGEVAGKVSLTCTLREERRSGSRTSIGNSQAHCSSSGSRSHSSFPVALPRLTIGAQSAQTANGYSHARPTTCEGTTSVLLSSRAWWAEASRM